MSLNKRLMSSAPAPFVASEHFKVVTWSGTGADQTITVGFQPDLVIYKETTSDGNWRVIDSMRGVTKYMELNENSESATGAETLKSFTSTGFTVGDEGDTNASGQTYIGYCWKVAGGTTANNTDGNATSVNQVNLAAGVSMMKLDDNTGSYTVGHGLGAQADFVLTKIYSTSSNWHVYHKTTGAGKYMFLNTNAAVATASSGYEYHTVNTSLVGNLISNSELDYMHYAWKEIEGFSKFGSYTGTGGTGNIVETGFEPAFVMTKKTTGTSNWAIFDNKRNTSNPRINFLRASSSDAEQTDPSNYAIDFFSNGFQWNGNGNDGNISGETYIYAAFAADPDTEAPTVAGSFGITTYTGNSTNDYSTDLTQSVTGLGFQPDVVWIKNRNHTYTHAIFDSVRGATYQIQPNTTAAQNSSAGYLKSFDVDGFGLGGDYAFNRNTYTYVAWGWKADDNEPTYNTNGSINSITSVNANAGFSIVKYTGNDVSGATVGHGLSAKPDFILIKNLSITKSWIAWHGSLSGELGYLDNNDVFASSRYSWAFNSTQPTSSLVTFNNNSNSNDSHTNAANNYIMYCWHAVSGYSKFGSYTGNGGTQTISGFGFQPDFIIIKSSTYNTSGWRMFDSVRGTDKSIRANLDSAEYDDTGNYITFVSDGFSMSSQTNTDLNDSGDTYLYAAWKIDLIMIDYLVIAGGGGGGEGRGGGGGAGGYISKTSSGISAGTTYTITVGAGGGNNTSGENSVFLATAIGGGKGGPAGVAGNNASGGSGGGGAGLSTTTEAGAAGTAGQGYAGGHGYYTGGTQRNGGGGGGASEVGENASANTSGDGGDGIASSITGSSVTRAGGGGGGDQLSGEGTGGAGGGGNGGRDTSIAATDGTANTGSGGGGGGGTGGTGGSGIVILRLLTSDYTGTTSGSPGVTTDGDYTVLQYTSSGTYTA